MAQLTTSYQSETARLLAREGAFNKIYPYILKLWLPFLVYTSVELAFKGYAYYFSSGSFAANAFILGSSYILRVFMEIALLSQLVMVIAGGRIKIADLYAIPFEKAMKVLFVRFLILMIFVLTVGIFSEMLAPDYLSTFNVESPYNYQNFFISLGLFAIFYGWFYLLVSWLYHTYFITIEGVGPITALSKSYYISKKHWWETLYTFGHAFVTGMVIITVISFFAMLVFGSIGVIFGFVTMMPMTKESLFKLWALYGASLFQELTLSIALQGFVTCVVFGKFLQLNNAYADSVNKDIISEESPE